MRLKSVLFLVLFFNIAKCSRAQEYYFNIDKDVFIEPVLYLGDSSPCLRKESSEVEINYIKEGISNVNIAYYNSTVYISWNVCDDMSHSSFAVEKTTDNITYTKVGTVNNVPCSPHVPVLYSLQDKNVTMNQSYFYKLYKISEKGEKIHIITIIVPRSKNFELESKKIAD